MHGALWMAWAADGRTLPPHLTEVAHAEMDSKLRIKKTSIIEPNPGLFWSYGSFVFSGWMTL